MPIVSEVSQSDKAALTRLKNADQLGIAEAVKRVEQYLKHIEALLNSVGIVDATVSFLHSDETIWRGATRIPLLITTNDEKFILKRYDKGDAETEKEMLEMFQGTLAPKTIARGKTLVIEEYIDPERYVPIAEVFKKNEPLACLLIAKTFAELATKSIRNTHGHYFDEMQVNKKDESIKITDFGSFERFVTEEQDSYNHYYFQEAKSKNIDELLRMIPNVDNFRLLQAEKYQQLMGLLSQLAEKSDPAFLLNVTLTLSTMVIGLAAFYGLDYEKYGDKWRAAGSNFDKLFVPFFEELNRLIVGK